MINTADELNELTGLSIMGSYIGIPPLLDMNDLSAEPDYVIAQRVLKTVTREVLNRGLELNTDVDYTLNQEIDGTVLVPAGSLRWNVVSDFEEYYVPRDGKVYHKMLKTDVLNEDLVVNIVWNLTFDSLPNIVKHYIIVKSALRFVGRMKASDDVLNQINMDLMDAEYEFKRYETGTSRRTMLDNPETNLISSRWIMTRLSYQ